MQKYTHPNYVEECPYCGHKFKNLYEIFSNKDYSNDFELECPSCKKEINVQVQAVPEFTLYQIENRAAIAESQPAINQQALCQNDKQDASA